MPSTTGNATQQPNKYKINLTIRLLETSREGQTDNEEGEGQVKEVGPSRGASDLEEANQEAQRGGARY